MNTSGILHQNFAQAFQQALMNQATMFMRANPIEQFNEKQEGKGNPISKANNKEAGTGNPITQANEKEATLNIRTTDTQISASTSVSSVAVNTQGNIANRQYRTPDIQAKPHLTQTYTRNAKTTHPKKPIGQMFDVAI